MVPNLGSNRRPEKPAKCRISLNKSNLRIRMQKNLKPRLAGSIGPYTNRSQALDALCEGKLSKAHLKQVSEETLTWGIKSLLQREVLDDIDRVNQWLKAGFREIRNSLENVQEQPERPTQIVLLLLPLVQTLNRMNESLPFDRVQEGRKLLEQIGFEVPGVAGSPTLDPLSGLRTRLVVLQGSLSNNVMKNLKKLAQNPKSVFTLQRIDVAEAIGRQLRTSLLDRSHRVSFIKQVCELVGDVEAFVQTYARIKERAKELSQGAPEPTQQNWRNSLLNFLNDCMRQWGELIVYRDSEAERFALERIEFLTSPLVFYFFPDFWDPITEYVRSDVGNALEQFQSGPRDPLMVCENARARLIVMAIKTLAFNSFLALVNGHPSLNANARKIVLEHEKESKEDISEHWTHQGCLRDLILYVLEHLLTHDPEFRLEGFHGQNPDLLLSEGIPRIPLLVRIRSLDSETKEHIKEVFVMSAMGNGYILEDQRAQLDQALDGLLQLSS